MIEPLGGFQAGRIEYSFRPMLIVPAACPDKAACSHGALLFAGFIPCMVDLGHSISKMPAGILNKIKVFGKFVD
jgi:hypothetical protein